MAHLQHWFGLLPPDIATILPWSESLAHPPVYTRLTLSYISIKWCRSDLGWQP